MKETEIIRKEDLLFNNKALVKLIWPLFVEQLLAVLVGMVDVMMVSSVGEAAVSGVSIIDSVNTLIIQMVLAVAAGGSVVIARYIGAKDYKGAKHSSAQLISVLLSASIVITVLLFVFGDGLINLIFGKIADDVKRNARTYLRFTIGSFPCLAVYSAGSAIFRAKGNTKISMYCSVLANICNAAGNAICIYILKIGVAGAAISTFMSRTIGAVIILIALQQKHSAINLRIDSIKDLKLDGKELKKMLSIGIPNGIESCIFQFGKLMLQSLVTSLGTASTAAYAVACNLATIFYLPGSALGNAILTITGQCYGAKKYEQAKYYTKRLLKINYIILIVPVIVMIFANELFLGLYNLSSEALVLASGLIKIHSIGMILWPVSFVTPNYFRAVNKAKFTMVVSISIMWVFRVGFAYFFIRTLNMSILGIWYAMMLDWCVRAVIYVPAFIKHKNVSLD